MFCLLAINGARDWRRGEAIQLQQLHDHHIFPQAYLKRRGITGKVPINTIANRTLISDETNLRISDRAPADYVQDPEVFPSGPSAVLERHFVGNETLETMKQATENLQKANAGSIYEEFVITRQRDIITAIRSAAGIGTYPIATELQEEEADDDDLAATETASGVSQTKTMQFEFWKELANYFRSNGTPLSLQRPGYQHWYNLTVGRAGCIVSLTINTREEELACKFYMHGDDSRRLFATLLDSRAEIENQLRAQLEWDDREGRRRCQIVQRRSGDIRSREDWPEYFAWLKDRAESFAATFGPRVASI